MEAETTTTETEQQTALTPSTEEAQQSTEQVEGKSLLDNEKAEQDGKVEPHKTIGKPDAYDFTNTEGAQPSEHITKSFTELATKLDLSQDAAKEILETMSPAIKKHNEEVANTMREDWAKASKNDKQIGGDKFNESISVAQKALNQFASPELKTFLNDTGLGNHPEVIRLLHSVGLQTSEDKRLITSTGVNNTKKSTEGRDFNSLAAALYPTHNG